MAKRCCIVIPVHSFSFNDFERQSIENTCKVLYKYDIYIVCPTSLNIEDFHKQTTAQNVSFAKFDSIWFQSYNAYNLLCLSAVFYEAFKQYDYMLIAQTDTWIFRDELQYWCDKGYDYIGAPWCLWCTNQNVCQSNDIEQDQCNIYGKPYGVSIPAVGNGGLSLRRIEKFIEMTNQIKIQHTYDKICCLPQIAEDTMFASFKNTNLKIPSCKTALKFSIETNGIQHVVKNGIKPFGCHKLNDYSIKAFNLLKT